MIHQVIQPPSERCHEDGKSNTESSENKNSSRLPEVQPFEIRLYGLFLRGNIISRVVVEGLIPPVELINLLKSRTTLLGRQFRT